MTCAATILLQIVDSIPVSSVKAYLAHKSNELEGYSSSIIFSD